MARPKKSRLPIADAKKVRQLVREGEALASLSHKDLAAAIGVNERWTENTLNRVSGIDPIDAYKILHAILVAVPVTDDELSRIWRSQAKAVYDHLQPATLIHTPVTTAAMYVPKNAVSEFGQALSEFLATRPIPILLSASACEAFLSRRVQPGWEATYGFDFRDACRKRLQTTIEWAIDSSEKIGTLSRSEVVGSIEDIDRAFARTRKRRAPQLRRVEREAARASRYPKAKT